MSMISEQIQLLKGVAQEFERYKLGTILRDAADTIEALSTKVHANNMHGGWMPIGDGKPPVGVPLIVTIKDSIRGRNELRYPVYYKKSLYGGCWGFYVYGDEDSLLLPEYSEVLAWCEFPEIYDGEELV